MVQRPFVMKYSYIKYSKINKHQKFVFDLRGIIVNLEHACQLNVSFLCESLKSSGLCKELHREQTFFCVEASEEQSHI